MLQESVKTLLHWVAERESVRKKKTLGYPKPWTDDPILRDYKFCNVSREDDKVTQWIHANWLDPYRDHPNLAFAMCVARHFNWPDTLELIGFPSKFDPLKTELVLKDARDRCKRKIYTGAYTVSTCGRAMDKIEYSLRVVLGPMYLQTRNPVKGETLQGYWKYLQQFEGFSSFMAGQVVADLKYASPLIDAPDWMDWAPLGPGSIRGLNRLHDRQLTHGIKQEQGLTELRRVQIIIKEKLGLTLPLHNVQNCLCEYDKYSRLKFDDGKVRSKYPGKS